MKESVYNTFVNCDPQEQDLLRQLIRGDIAGYEVLFHKYYPTFFAFIKGMTKETAVAEDIAQNIFMKVWLNREKLDAAKSIRNYLFVLAKHEIYNYFRTKSRTFTTLKEAFAERDRGEARSGGDCRAGRDHRRKDAPAAAADFPHVAFRAHAEQGDRRTTEPVGTHRGQAS